MTELLLRTQLSAEQKSYLDIIQSSGESLLRIISDVLDISKIESNSLKLESIPVNLKAVVAKAISSLRVMASQKGIEVSLPIAG